MQHTLNASAHTLEITFPGDLLSTNADTIRADILALLGSAPVKSGDWNALQLDLTAAKMIDSVGLNLIVAIYKEAQKRQAKTIARISSPNIQRTFLFTRLDKHLQVEMAA